MAKNNEGLVAAIVIAALLISGSLVFLGTRTICDTDAMKTAVIDGVTEFVNGPQPEAEAPNANPGDTAPSDSADLTDDDAVLGDSDAPVTIVEFSDYQCPYCARFYAEAYQEIKEKYVETGKVKIVFRDFPLGNHSGAYPSALAAECVRDQAGDSAYYEMHNRLFENQNILSGEQDQMKEAFIGFAEEIGVDADEFNECVESDKFEEEIYSDMVDAQNAGIGATPSFVIDGKILVGAQPFEAFEKVIEEALGGL